MLCCPRSVRIRRAPVSSTSLPTIRASRIAGGRAIHGPRRLTSGTRRRSGQPISGLRRGNLRRIGASDRRRRRRGVSRPATRTLPSTNVALATNSRRTGVVALTHTPIPTITFLRIVAKTNLITRSVRHRDNALATANTRILVAHTPGAGDRAGTRRIQTLITQPVTRTLPSQRRTRIRRRNAARVARILRVTRITRARTVRQGAVSRTKSSGPNPVDITGLRHAVRSTLHRNLTYTAGRRRRGDTSDSCCRSLPRKDVARTLPPHARILASSGSTRPINSPRELRFVVVDRWNRRKALERTQQQNKKHQPQPNSQGQKIIRPQMMRLISTHMPFAPIDPPDEKKRGQALTRPLPACF